MAVTVWFYFAHFFFQFHLNSVLRLYFQHKWQWQIMCSQFSVYHTVCTLYVFYTVQTGIGTGTRYVYIWLYVRACVWVCFFVCLECYGLLFEIFFTLGVFGRCVNTNHFFSTQHSTPYTGSMLSVSGKIQYWKFRVENIVCTRSRSPTPPPP